MISRWSLCLAIIAIALPALAGDQSVNWQNAPKHTVVLFYPGLASWEKLLISATHDGAKGVRAKQRCTSCHAGNETQIGERISHASEHRFYRKQQQIASVEAKLQIATDTQAIHFRVELPAIDSGQLTLMIDDGSYAHAALSGCWSACHDDARGMASAGSLDLSKYLSASRTNNTQTGGADSFKSADALQALHDDKQFMEMLGVHFSANSVQPLEGYVLEARHFNKAPQQAASVQQHGKQLLIELSRPLAGNTDWRKAIRKNGSYSLALAWHPNDAHGPEHLVSFGIDFQLDDAGNIRFIDSP